MFFFFDSTQRTVSGFDIHYDGPILDAMAVGILHTHLQLIVEGVAHDMLVEEGILPRSAAQARKRLRTRSGPVVRVVVDDVEVGSLIEQVSVMVSPLLGDPMVVAVLQGLATNVVWELARCGVPRVRALGSTQPSSRRETKKALSRTASLLRDIIEAFNETGDCQPRKITIRTRGGDEITVDLGPVQSSKNGG